MVSGNSGGSASGSGYQYDPPPPPPPPALPQGSVPPGNNRPNPSTNSQTASSQRRGPSVFSRLQRGRASPSTPPQDPGGQRHPAPGSWLHGHTTSAEDQKRSNTGTSSPSARRSSHDAPITIPEEERSTRESQSYAGTSRRQASATGANPGSRNQPGNAGPSRPSQHPLDGYWQTSYLYVQQKSSYPPPPSVESVDEDEEDEFANPREPLPTYPREPGVPSANEQVPSSDPRTPEPDEILPPEILLREPRPYASQGVPPPVGRPAHPFTLERTDTDASVLEIPPLQRTDTDVSIVEIPSREPRPYASQGPGSTHIAGETSGPDRPDSPLSVPAREPRPYSSQGLKVSGANEETLPFFPPPRESRPYSSQGSAANEDTLPFNPPRESRPYSSQGPGVSTAGGETKDTIPLRPGADNTRDLSSTEIALLPDCPKGNPVPWGLWFQVPSLPGFDVCSKCYYTHIHRSPLRSKFSPAVDRPEGVAVGCYFYTPRILQLWEAALRGGNFEPLLRYAEARIRIPHCNKLEPGIGERWWVVPGDMPNFQACEACYNDLVLASSFASRFTPLAAPWDGIYCSLGIPGLQKRFLRLIESRSPAHGNTWWDFVRSANHRISEVPKCAGTASVHDPRVWWTCKKAIPGFAICEACYLDEVEPSPWHDMFTPAPDKQSWLDEWSCGFAILPVKLSWQLALNDVARDFDDFWKCAGAALSMPPCHGQAIEGGEWYRMLNVGNFSVCPTCYHTLIKALGFGGCFHREYSEGSLSSCDMSPESPGHHALLAKLGEALGCKDFSRFEAYAHARSLIPPCPGNNTVTGRKWYGTDSFMACEGCYADLIEPSPLVSQLTIQGATTTDAASCDIYSPRMRAIWAQACEVGNLDHFSTAAKHRTEVYFRTTTEMRMINETIDSQLALKTSLMANAAMIEGLARTKSYVGGRSTYRYYGNSEIGYGYDSPEEVEAAAMKRRADEIGNGDPALWQKLLELEQEWKAVE